MAVGQSPTRKDAVAKVTGRARYTGDLTMPGMLHAVYVRSPVAHGRVVRIETGRAAALSGVEAVFTFEDVPRERFPTAGHPYALDPEHADVADRTLLTGHVRYQGDEVAVVVARDRLTAERAARLVEVEYEVLPALVTPEAALAPGAPEIHPGGNVVDRHGFEAGGDVEGALAGSDAVVEGRYTTSINCHCHLEGHVAWAYMDDADHVVVVSSTQIPHIVRRIVGQAVGIPLSRVRVVKPHIGGGFGAKQDVVLEPMAAFLTMRLGGAPVKLDLTREECFTATRTRHAVRIAGRVGVARDGTIRALDLECMSNTGAYASHGHAIMHAGCSKSTSLYPRSAIRMRATTHYANVPAAGAMRAYGTPQVTFGIECLVEEAARAIGMDPLELRLRNVARQGDVNPLTGERIESCALAACLEKGRELIRWDEKRRLYRGQAGPVRRGLGVACFSYGSGTYPACVEISSVRLVLNQDGTVHLQAGAAEIGQGADTAFCQMAAQTLGVPFDRVHPVSTQDTDVAPFDTGAYASRQTYTVAPAVKEAARLLREKILRHAAEMTGRSPESLDLAGGDVVAAGRPGGVVLPLAEVARDSYYHKERGGQLTAEVSRKTVTNAPSYGCTFVDVEVDIPLCRVAVREIYNVHDAGRIVHPVMAEGQVHGGLLMGIGMALHEELLVDPATGRIHNNNLLDYKMPTFVDAPDLGCAFVETTEPTGAYGNKSLGEPPIITPAPAIRNAVWDATGVRIDEIPITPKVLYRHLARAGLV